MRSLLISLVLLLWPALSGAQQMQLDAAAENARQAQALFLGAVDSDVVARIGMAHDAGCRSFQSTRSRRQAASSVPSAHMTTAECCEKPMPTPPP